MCFVYCITSSFLRDDHYKIGMTMCKDEGILRSYLIKRYGTAYGCCVNIILFKEVGNPRISEKYVHTALKKYCKGGEMYSCTVDIINDVFNSIPYTEMVNKIKLSISEAIKKYTSIPDDFINDFLPLYQHDTKQDAFVINIDNIAKWLDVEKKTLTSTLKHSYKVGTGYTLEKVARDPSIKYGANNSIKVMLTPKCAKLLCMRSHSEQSEKIRLYFIDIEKFLLKYNNKKTSISG